MATTTQSLSTPLDTLSQSVAKLRAYFNTGATRPLAYRQQQLAGLMRFLTECESKLEAALQADLGKSSAEALAMEIGFTRSELKLTQQHLAKWVKPKKVSTSLMVQPGMSHIYPEPLGVVLIISPWNYPVQLTLSPLIGAIAAGNCVLLKPSEMAPATSQLLATELPKYLDTKSFCLIEGGVAETTALLAETFDHIFYTGNGTVGRIVMTAAAKHLTPVTLELGGKSPCFVDATTNIATAARRIAWGKFTNAGQTCIAPDYVLVEASVEAEFLRQLKIATLAFYGDNPKTSRDYGRVINAHHYQRIMNLLPGSGDIYLGGSGEESERYIAPTVLHNVPHNAPVMADEIFGPVLPVIAVNNVNEAITFINARPKPLALYIFSESHESRQKLLTETSSGSVGINYPMFQAAVSTLPFGGVGASGMGAYHGKFSFDTFSHFKSVLVKPMWFELKIFYPPYGGWFMRLIKWLQ